MCRILGAIAQGHGVEFAPHPCPFAIHSGFDCVSSQTNLLLYAVPVNPGSVGGCHPVARRSTILNG
jgi:hypothetical protein